MEINCHAIYRISVESSTSIDYEEVRAINTPLANTRQKKTRHSILNRKEVVQMSESTWLLLLLPSIQLPKPIIIMVYPHLIAQQPHKFVCHCHVSLSSRL